MDRASTSLNVVTQSWPGGLDLDIAPPEQQSWREMADAEELLAKLRKAESEAQISLAALELVGKLEGCPDLHRAAFTLAAELASYLGIRQVVVGLCHGRKRACRLAAISGVAGFDRRSDVIRSLEAALDESLLRDRLGLWPCEHESDRAGMLAHQRLAAVANVDALASSPIRNAQGESVGAVLLLGTPSPERRPELPHFLRVCERPVGSMFDLLRRTERGPVMKLMRAIVRLCGSWGGRVYVLATCIALACLAMPMNYKIDCACQIQPVTRRFVAAPFAGTLEKSLVAPGDVVAQGQVLARLDGREIRWELAGLIAERNRAAKQRDTSLASQNVAAAQSARLEMERLELKIRLLEHRTDNLEVKTLIAGIVVSGDLEKAEGAPLTIGQTLFEVAPLDRMVVEVGVPESDVSYVREGLAVTVRLDAYRHRTWNATIEKLHPRAEIQDAQCVFVAELALDNADLLLRPGMNGRAKIVGPPRSLAWNLFHKPVEWLTGMLGW